MNVCDRNQLKAVHYCDWLSKVCQEFGCQMAYVLGCMNCFNFLPILQEY